MKYKKIKYKKIKYDLIKENDPVKNKFEIRTKNTPPLFMDGYIYYDIKDNNINVYVYGYINTMGRIQRNIELNQEGHGIYIENIHICNYEIFELKIL